MINFYLRVMRKITVIIVLLSLVILILAGCNKLTAPTAPTTFEAVPEERPSPPQLAPEPAAAEVEETEVVEDSTVTATEAVVEITASGFNPATVTVAAGGSVTWVNKDTARHWPASAVHPTHRVYPQSTGACPAIGGSDFDACKGLQPDEDYTFTFAERGSWKYHDHLNLQLTGTVVVE